MCWLPSVRLYSLTSFFIQHRVPSVHLPHFHLKTILLIMIRTTTFLFLLFEQEKEPHPPSLFLFPCSTQTASLSSWKGFFHDVNANYQVLVPTSHQCFRHTGSFLSSIPEHPSVQTGSSVSSEYPRPQNALIQPHGFVPHWRTDGTKSESSALTNALSRCLWTQRLLYHISEASHVAKTVPGNHASRGLFSSFPFSARSNSSLP